MSQGLFPQTQFSFEDQIARDAVNGEVLRAPSSGWKERFLPFFIVIFILGWISDGYSLVDFGKYSILLLYIAALPFCFYASSRTLAFFSLPAISTLFAVCIGLLEGVRVMSVISQTALQLLALLFAAGIAAIDWKKHFPLLAKILAVIALPVILYGGYQMSARPAHAAYAFLPVTNQQAYAVGGYQRGWEKAHFTRASSVFVEPSDFGYFCLWVLVLGLSSDKGRWRYFLLTLAFLGILFSQSLSAVLGVGIFLIAYLITNPISFKSVRQIAIIILFSIIAVLCIQPLMPEAFDKFYKRVEEAVSLDERADSGRVDHLPACWAIIKDAPVWGHGMASVNSADDNGTDVTSIAYALLLMERGTVGTLLFMIPWLFLAFKALTSRAGLKERTPGLLLSALHLYCFATFSLAYFLPFWLSLGVAASLLENTHLPSRKLVLGRSSSNQLPALV